MTDKDNPKNRVVANRRRRQSNPIAKGEIASPHALRAGARNDTIPTGLPSDYKSDERILAPIPGVVMQIFVEVGQRVAPGEPLLVIEAMKMKNTLRSGHALTVAGVHVRAGETIPAGKLLVEFERKGRLRG